MAKKKVTKKKSTPKKTTRKKTPDLVIPKGFWANNWIPALILFLLSFVLYFQSTSFEYVLDDKIVFNENGLVKKGFAGIGEILGTESMTGYFGQQRDLVEGARYRPLSLVTFAIEHQFFGKNNYKIEDYWVKEMNKIPDLQPQTRAIQQDPVLKGVMFPDEASFLNALQTKLSQSLIDKHREQILFHAAHASPAISHFINILLYALTALLLFRVLNIIFPSEKKEWYMTIGFLATLLFVLHPVHTEVVANVKGRDEIMTLLGSLGLMYFSLKYIATEKPLHLIASGVTMFLALLAKENAITFLAVVPLTIYFFTKSSFQKNFMATLPLIVAVAVYLAWRYSVIGYLLGSGKPVTDLMNNPFVQMTGSEKFATIFYTLGLYVKLLFVPHPLTHDYYPYQIPIMDWSKIGSILSLLLYIGMGVYALLGLKKKSVISYGILFYLATLSIVSNIPFSVGTFMNERFLYVSSVGFCIILAYLITEKLPAPVLNIGVLGLFVIGFTAKTFARVPAWENGYTLNAAAIQYSPNSARANCFMGTALFDNFYRQETDRTKKMELLNEIAGYIDRALEIHPRYGSALTMKGGVAAEFYKNDRDVNKLLQAFEMIAKIKRKDDFVDQYLDYIAGRGNVQEQINFYHRLGYQHFTQTTREYNWAIYYLQMGLKVDPNNTLLRQDIGQTYQLMGDNAKAQQYLN